MKNTRKTCYLRTFGCQMNEHDSAKMRLMLTDLGYNFADQPEGADLILYNTCTIREKAHQKAVSELGRAKFYKGQNPNTIIGICGCVAQQDGLQLARRFPELDLIFGPDQIAKLPELLAQISKARPVAALDLINSLEDYDFPLETPSQVESGHAFVTIMKGCNCACSYCIVPKVRGKEVSRQPEEVIKEVQNLVKSGTKEITLLGQNVTAYQQSGLSLAGLIAEISQQTEIKRIRFTSPHPKDVKPDLIAEYGRNEKLCPHLHLPIQSASNAMLKKMIRGYTREKYLEIVETLRRVRPDISITSDFIVGFCSETEADFQDTINLLKEIEFDSIFAFKYSVRPGTFAAEKFADDVPDQIKDKRLAQVLDLQREITRQSNERLVGQTFSALVTGFDRQNTGKLTGRLPNNKIINFTGKPDLVGSIITVHIKRALANSLEGKYES
ncbi:MAG: tRNA (N6-isopentenyl adenosine(37)-C2)-methylthiotransferase MiaB [Pseudomonadota bacterium]